MKKRYILLILLIAVAAFLVLRRDQKPIEQTGPSEPANDMGQLAKQPNGQRSTRSPESSAVFPSNATANPSAPDPQKDPAAWIEWRRKQINEEVQRGLNEWRTPIEFYGLVVDENTNAIADAQVDFDCNDLSATGTSYYHTESDQNGLFSVKGITGKLLGVYVKKEGYYSYEPHGQHFYYAGQNQNFVPDPGSPVVFRLRRKGIAEPLIHFDKGFNVPKDGSPVLIDLATGKIASSSRNALRVECWTRDSEKKEVWKFDWKCRVSVPGGGLHIYDETFPFLAPENGYLPFEEIDMTVREGVPWTQDIQRNYFIRTADGKFGRLSFRMIAHGEHFCRINSYFNPSGARNLEPP